MYRVHPTASFSKGRPARRAAIAAVVLAGLLAESQQTAQAAPPSVTVSVDQLLRFGSFFTATSGSRSISASGTVSGSAIIPVIGASPGPAQFTITYDRGNDANISYSLLISVMVPGSASEVSGGVIGTIAHFDTDLPGISMLLPGQTMQTTLVGCRRRICSRTFRVGGTLQVMRTHGGAQLAVPVPIVVTVLAEL